MSTSVIREHIQNFIIEHFPIARQRHLSDNSPLLENGILDSLGVLELVTYLEQEFKISVADEELVPENFQTIMCVTAFVEKKSDNSPGYTPTAQKS
jgi:acyl carrier protein